MNQKSKDHLVIVSICVARAVGFAVLYLVLQRFALR